MNITFMPMHWLGIAGMARRIYTYRPEYLTLNQIISAGYLLMLLAGAIFIGDLLYTLIAKKRTAPADAWGVNDVQKTLDWETTSPPAPHNFDRLPRIA
jgi:heme/copper-type cytochrome/quinol oxidase subunit 1